MWVEKGRFTSFDLAYSSKISPEIKIRDVKLHFAKTYYMKNFILSLGIPFEYTYKYNAYLVPKSKEIFTINNFYFAPSYRFEKRDFLITCNLNILFPTLSKLSGDLEIEKNKIFGIQPGIGISKVSDPLLSNLKFSFFYPIWSKEKDKKDIPRSINIGTAFYFLINEKFSYILELDFNMGKEFERYIVTTGIGYFLTSDKEAKLSFSNFFTGFMNESAINLSFNIRR